MREFIHKSGDSILERQQRNLDGKIDEKKKGRREEEGEVCVWGMY